MAVSRRRFVINMGMRSENDQGWRVYTTLNPFPLALTHTCQEGTGSHGCLGFSPFHKEGML